MGNQLALKKSRAFSPTMFVTNGLVEMSSNPVCECFSRHANVLLHPTLPIGKWYSRLAFFCFGIGTGLKSLNSKHLYSNKEM